MSVVLFCLNLTAAKVCSLRCLLLQLPHCYWLQFWNKAGCGPKAAAASPVNENTKDSKDHIPRARLQTPAQIEQRLLSKSCNNSAQQTITSHGKCPACTAGQREVLLFVLNLPTDPTTLQVYLHGDLAS